VFFADVAATSGVVASTSSRKAKTATIAELLRQTTDVELPIVATWLAGDLRQRRLGVGWAYVFRDGLEHVAASEPTLSVVDLDEAFATLAATSGEGSQGARRTLLDDVFARATAVEANMLRSMLTSGVRQGALAGVVLDAIALAFDVPAAAVRRAHLLSGDLGDAAVAASHGQDALDAISLHVGRALQPMLASTSPSVTDAVTELGTVSVEWKLDGARIQVHRRGDNVWVFTRNLNDVTHRLPEVVDVIRQLPVDTIVLDGEVLGLDDEGRPRAFQQTMSRFGTEDDEAPASSTGLAPFFFDVMHVDGRDLLDEPLTTRLAELGRIAPSYRVPGIITDNLDAAIALQTDALARGHEGVMVKAADSIYDAGRRGSSWRKVKPVRTFDLVVLGVEWGSGRRQGWLSNIHLGARNPTDDSFVMVGKTFKGMTDAMLTWQTEQFLAREVRRTAYTVYVRPELVVEIAIDGVQHSSRYPGGVALRFARVKGYRSDKSPSEADTIDSLRALLP
jgi:DNA ligase 1